MSKLLLIICLMISSNMTFAGGITGGGGNIKPSKAISIQELNSLIGSARLQLLLFLNHLDNRRHSLPTFLAILIKDKDLIYQVNNTRNHVFKADNGPCFDNDGRAVDGSTNAPEGYAICISTYTISKQVDKRNALIQLTALMAHEFSHMAGADEAEANLVQEYIIDNMEVLPVNSASEFLSELSLTIYRADLSASSLKNLLVEHDWDAICKSAEEINRHFENFIFNSTSGNQSWFNLQQKKIIESYRWQFANLAIGSCIMAKSNSDPTTEWNMHDEYYKKIFKDSSNVSINNFLKYIAPSMSTGKFIEGFTIPYLATREVLKTEVMRSKKLLRYLENECWFSLRTLEIE